MRSMSCSSSSSHLLRFSPSWLRKKCQHTLIFHAAGSVSLHSHRNNSDQARSSSGRGSPVKGLDSYPKTSTVYWIADRAGAEISTLVRISVFHWRDASHRMLSRSRNFLHSRRMRLRVKHCRRNRARHSISRGLGEEHTECREV